MDIKCDQNDFEKFTPGIHGKHHCFQGAIGLTYIKTSNRICEINIKNLIKISPIPCKCSMDDFHWYF